VRLTFLMIRRHCTDKWKVPHFPVCVSRPKHPILVAAICLRVHTLFREPRVQRCIESSKNNGFCGPIAIGLRKSAI
jgi:hypothetical protein